MTRAPEHLHPTVGLIAVGGAGFVSLLCPSWWGGAALSGLLIVTALLLHHYRFAAAVSATFAALVVFIVGIRMFFLGDPQSGILFTVGALTANKQGLLDGLWSSSLLLAIGVSIMFLFATAPVHDITLLLEQWGMPAKASYVVLASMQMVPQLRDEIARVSQAQETRGMAMTGSLAIRFKAFLPSLGPVILSALVNTEERAVTMETRGFLIPGRRQRARQLVWRRRDTLVADVVIVTCSILVALRWGGW